MHKIMIAIMVLWRYVCDDGDDMEEMEMELYAWYALETKFPAVVRCKIIYYLQKHQYL